MPFIGEAWLRLSAKTEEWSRGMHNAIGDLNTLQGRCATTSRQLSRVGSVLAMVGAAATAMSGAAVAAFASFEDSLAYVSTIMSEQSERLLPEYAEGIKTLSVEIGHSTSALSNALFTILNASVDASKAMDVLRVSSIAAEGGFVDVSTAAKAITDVLSSYKMPASEAARVSDVMFNIMDEGKVTFAELTSLLAKATSITALSGLKFEELAAAIATITDAGVPAQLAVTSIISLVEAFRSPSEAAVDVAQRLGITLNTTTLKSLGLGGAIKALSSATEEQLSTIVSSDKAYRGLRAILEDMPGFYENLNVNMGKTGSSLKAQEKASSTLGDSIRDLGAAIKVGFISAGEQLGGVMRSWTSVTRALVDGFNALPDVVQKIIALFVYFSGSILLLAGTWTFLAAKFLYMLPTLIKMGHLFVVATTAVKGFVLALSPLTIGIIGVIAVAALLVNSFISMKAAQEEAAAQNKIYRLEIDASVKSLGKYRDALASASELTASHLAVADRAAKKMEELLRARELLVTEQQDRSWLGEWFNKDVFASDLAAIDVQIEALKKRMQVITAEGAKVQAAQQEAAAAGVGPVQLKLSKEMVKEMQEVDDMLLSAREGDRALELVKLDRWYAEMQTKYVGYQDELSRIAELYSVKRKEIMESEGEVVTRMLDQTADRIESSFADAFDNVVWRTGTFTEIMTSFAMDITHAFTRMAAEILASYMLWGAVLGPAGSTGGLLGSFGLGKPVAAQEGGIFTKPTLALIGEAGPEAVVPLDKASGMGKTTNVTFNVSAIDAQGTYQFLNNNKALLATMLSRAEKDNHPLRRNL